MLITFGTHQAFHDDIFNAAAAGENDVLQVLIERKNTINMQDMEMGWTLLMHACANDQYTTANFLIGLGADSNFRNKVDPPPSIA